MKPRGSCYLARAMLLVWLLNVPVRGHEDGSGIGALDSIGKLDHHLHDSQPSSSSSMDTDEGFESAELTTGYSHSEGSGSPFNHVHRLRCHACEYRSMYSMASLKSIKAHVLMKLGLSFPPNRTQYPEVPQAILNMLKQPEGYRTPGPSSDDYGYMNDAPSVPAEDVEEDYEYYPIMNKIFILPTPVPG